MIYFPPGGRVRGIYAPTIDFRSPRPWSKGMARAQSAPMRSIAFQLPFCGNFSKTKNVSKIACGCVSFRYTPAPPGAQRRLYICEQTLHAHRGISFPEPFLDYNFRARIKTFWQNFKVDLAWLGLFRLQVDAFAESVVPKIEITRIPGQPCGRANIAYAPTRTRHEGGRPNEPKNFRAAGAKRLRR